MQNKKPLKLRGQIIFSNEILFKYMIDGYFGI
jgi:hypothetical protein